MSLGPAQRPVCAKRRAGQGGVGRGLGGAKPVFPNPWLRPDL